MGEPASGGHGRPPEFGIKDRSAGRRGGGSKRGSNDDRTRNHPLRTLLLSGVAALSFGVADARAQANVDAVATAGDAFGFIAGDEAVGIYDTSAVRGFDLEAAGNYRIDGMYFVKSSGTSTLFIESTTVRVGAAALALDLPGPSGVVDYRLRDPKRGEPGYATLGLGDYAQPYAEVLLKHRDAEDRFSLALGGGAVFEIDNGQGLRAGGSAIVAGVGRASLGPARVRIFGGEYRYERPSQLRFSLADGVPLPRPPRGRRLAPDWMVERGQRRILGLQGVSALASGWTAEVSGVFSQEDPTRAYAAYILDVDGQGAGEGAIVASPHQRATALSSEARLAWSNVSGALSQRAAVLARGRISTGRFGGDLLVPLGEVSLNGPAAAAPAPDLSSRDAQLRDRTTQWGLGATYRLDWAGRLQLNAGLLRTDYRKTFRAADGARTRGEARPWLYNLGAAARLGPQWDVYGSVSRGLEEAGTAPDSAANRNAILPAIRVTQREFGTRYALTPTMKLVVAGFEIEKPYAALDDANVFGLSGTVRHRGVEASLAGAPRPGVSVLVGGVYLDPRILGGARDGSRPVGVARVRGVANVSYQPAGLPALSLDAGLEHIGARPRQADAPQGRQAKLAADTYVNLGFRYRLPTATPVTVRGQVLNVFGHYGYNVDGGETLAYDERRRVKLLLTAEF